MVTTPTTKNEEAAHNPGALDHHPSDVGAQLRQRGDVDFFQGLLVPYIS